jgi:uncharacterized protein (DUF697 family)
MPRKKRSTLMSNPLDSIASARKAALTASSGKSTQKKVIITKTASKVASTPSPKPRKGLAMNTQTTAQAEPATVLENESSSVNNETIDYRNQLAKSTIKNSAWWATAAGFIPFTFVDTATIAGVQVKMVYDLCEVYHVPFKKESALAIIASLTGGSLTTFAAKEVGTLGMRNIPVVGYGLTVATQPALAYASTYALGVIFINHFEAHGDLIDFDLEKTNQLFKDQYEKAKGLYSTQSAKVKGFFKRAPKAAEVSPA